MAQEKKENIYRINKHKDDIVHHNPDSLKAFEERNKQLKEIFKACGYKIRGIDTSVGYGDVMLNFTFGKHYSFRALSTDRYIILIDAYDYKQSKIRVQLVTDTNLDIKKIKPKIEKFMDSVKEKMADIVIREEHKERDIALKDAIVKELGYPSYNGWENHGKDRDEICITYNVEIDEKETNTNSIEDGKNRCMGVQIHLKLERWEDEEHDYKIKDAHMKVDMYGNAYTCLGDDVDYMDKKKMEITYMDRIKVITERINELMQKAHIIKNCINKQVQKLDGYIIDNPCKDIPIDETPESKFVVLLIDSTIGSIEGGTLEQHLFYKEDEAFKKGYEIMQGYLEGDDFLQEDLSKNKKWKRIINMNCDYEVIITTKRTKSRWV